MFQLNPASFYLVSTFNDNIASSRISRNFFNCPFFSPPSSFSFSFFFFCEREESFFFYFTFYFSLLSGIKIIIHAYFPPCLLACPRDRCTGSGVVSLTARTRGLIKVRWSPSFVEGGRGKGKGGDFPRRKSEQDARGERGGWSVHRGGIIAEREGKSARRKSRKPAALRSN